MTKLQISYIQKFLSLCVLSKYEIDKIHFHIGLKFGPLL